LDNKNDEIANKALKDATAYYVQKKADIQKSLKDQIETAKKALGNKFPSDPGGQFQKMVD
ncbi:BMP family ABC transporter substrate-binding protein, partial [Escherichia coli]|nr:BMP family ABC transporter substrate-binding protein [Escherichia coli]